MQQVDNSTRPPSWKAYGDLFQLAQDEKGGSREKLIDALNADAKNKRMPRCRYCKRDIDYWKAPPKNCNPSRKPRAYRIAHLHSYFSELLGRLGETENYSAHLQAVAPTLSPLQPAKRETEKKSKHILIKIDLSRFSAELEPLELRHDALRDVGDFTNQVYLALDDFIEPYHYGKTWALRDKATGKVLKNYRIIKNLGVGSPVPDPRPLSDVGIIADTEFEAIRLV